MEYSRFLDCLATDFARLRAVVPTDPTAAVPTCPGWTVADLTRHVGEVYLHKTLAMREGAEPDPWPPKELAEEEPLALLDRAYAGLLDEFAARKPEDPAGSWYTPDQTVGFWIRRMAHETVIHRVDAELAAGAEVAEIPADFAADGIDEVLVTFLAYAARKWPEDFDDLLRDQGSILVGTGGARWLVRLGAGTLRVTTDSAGQAAAQVSGGPAAVLLWLWGRGADSTVRIDGDPAMVARLRGTLVAATQ